MLYESLWTAKMSELEKLLYKQNQLNNWPLAHMKGTSSQFQYTLIHVVHLNKKQLRTGINFWSSQPLHNDAKVQGLWIDMMRTSVMKEFHIAGRKKFRPRAEKIA